MKQTPPKYLIVIAGATATGKTKAAIELARHFKTEIISADSRQFYREMNIGTAKPTAEERLAAPHHFVDALSIEEPYSVGQFERDTIRLLKHLFEKYDRVILTGGSGLFIRAVCEGLDSFPEVPKAIVDELQLELQEKGIQSLQQELQEKDPDYYAEVDLDNPHRLIRALSVCRVSGQPFSLYRKGCRAERFFTPVYLLLERDRQELYERINQRVDEMISQGLIEEAELLFPKRALNSLQTVGYQELFDYMEGKCTREEAIEKIKQNTRRYAKRQQTWFRKDPHWHSFSPEDIPGMISYLEQNT